MKTIKKIAALALSTVFVLQISAFAQKAENPKAYYDTQKKAIVVSGVSPYGEGTVATVSISKGSDLFYFNFCKTLRNGAFEFECLMDSEKDSSGTYNVTVGGAALDGVVLPDGVVFVNSSDTQRILGEIEESTGETLLSVIEKTENVDLINVELDGDILSLSNQSSVFGSLAGQTFDDVPAFREAFYAAVAIQSFNENTAEKAEELLEKYSDDLGIDKEELFDDIKTDALKKDVYDAVCNKNIELKKEKFKEAFDKACYTALFNGFDSKDRENFIPYLEACNDAGYTNANIDTYKKLKNEADKVNLVKDIIKAKNEKKFADLNAVEKLFNDELKELTQPKEEEEKEESNKVITIGGSGGGGGSKDPKKDEPEKEPEKDETQEPDKEVFDDLKTVPWAKKEIEELASKGVINGVGNNKFNPDGFVTREEFIKLAVGGFNLPSEKTNNSFIDVKEGDWFYEAVMNAYALGIINGIDFDTFGTGTKITREQLCAIVYRAMLLLDVRIEVKDMTVEIADKEKISDYATEAVEAMFRAGIVSGVGNGNFAPDSYATRAQAAKIIYEVMERIG